MVNTHLKKLLKAYRESDIAFQATSYWESYEKDITDTISKIDISELRSGKYPILATFGFNDVVFTYHPHMSVIRKYILKFIQQFLIGERSILPYANSLHSLRQAAMANCKMFGELTGAKPIKLINMSKFGNPADLINYENNSYSVAFLDYYYRYCFANKYIKLRGDEVIVELGSGSGYQIEMLKKFYPDLTILCFDLPAQLYLCELYLSEAVSREQVVSSEETIYWDDLSGIQKGKIHFFGSWQFPMLKNIKIDIFWNAASFGEMEPEIVQNYLGYILDNATWVYLLQTRFGKELAGKTHVKKQTSLEDYQKFLEGFEVAAIQDANKTFGCLPGYFEGVWKKLT